MWERLSPFACDVDRARDVRARIERAVATNTHTALALN